VTATVEGTSGKGLVLTDDFNVSNAIAVGLLDLKDCFDQLRRKVTQRNIKHRRFFIETGDEASRVISLLFLFVVASAFLFLLFNFTFIDQFKQFRQIPALNIAKFVTQ
jgi:hypothetical protein